MLVHHDLNNITIITIFSCYWWGIESQPWVSGRVPICFMIGPGPAKEGYNLVDFENKVWASFFCCQGRLFRAAAYTVMKWVFVKPAGSAWKFACAATRKLVSMSQRDSSLFTFKQPFFFMDLSVFTFLCPSADSVSLLVFLSLAHRCCSYLWLVDNNIIKPHTMNIPWQSFSDGWFFH